MFAFYAAKRSYEVWSAMLVKDFLSRHHNRAPNVMWFLGAGASASAGVQTAGHMIWDFKRTLFSTAQKVPVRRIPDLGDEAVRARIHSYLDAEPGNPKRDSEAEYSHYFERVHPTEADRRRCMEQMIRGSQPSFGHRVLALLLRYSRVNLVWTTNFDRLVENALAAQNRGEAPVVGTLDTPHVALDAINENRWPVVVKLHGDYQSRRLKNTSAELQTQDDVLRRSLVNACRRFGLAVVGYSGRDDSVMDSLLEAVHEPGAFPNGLFWFHRGESEPLPRVVQLIAAADTAGIDAAIVRCETFDELMGDLLLLETTIPESEIEKLVPRARVSDAPAPQTTGDWPIVRLNAIPLLSAPSCLRLVDCEIGGTKDVRAAVEASGKAVVAARSQQGVIAFGADADVRAIFEPFGIKEFTLFNLDERRLRGDNGVSGLVLEALALGLVREFEMIADRHRHFHVLRPADPSNRRWNPLRLSAQGTIAGVIEGVAWCEAVRLRLAFHHGRVWLVADPRVWTERRDEKEDPASEFVRERVAKRYNRQWLAILDGWLECLVGPRGATRTIRALGVSDGVDATFELRSVTAVARKGRQA